MAKFTATFQGQLDKSESKDWNLRLNVYTSDNAREIWNTPLSGLEISFELTSINFLDGEMRTYNSEEKIIHAIV